VRVQRGVIFSAPFARRPSGGSRAAKTTAAEAIVGLEAGAGSGAQRVAVKQNAQLVTLSL
jgi:hypothetical protein